MVTLKLNAKTLSPTEKSIKMKLLSYVLNAKYLIFIVSLTTTSCAFNVSNIKTSSIVKATSNYKQVYEKQAYTNQKINFLSAGHSLAISDSSDVLIVNLKNNKIIKKLKTPDSMITSSFASKSGNRFILSTDMSTQIWDTQSWELLKKFDAKQLSKLSGISPNGDILYFDSTLWSLDNYKIIKNTGDELQPGSYAFSNDSQYFITSEHRFGAIITHIKDKDDGITTTRINNIDKTKFRSDNNYYVSYNAKFIVEQGGYLAGTIGLFNIERHDVINSYTPGSRITCWTVNNNNGILVSLFNGDIVLLNEKLKITHKWHIDNDHIYTCINANNNDIWLGGKKTGLYKAELTGKTLTKTYETSNMITGLKISDDNKKLGLVEAITGGSIVKIFELDSELPPIKRTN